MHTARIQHLKIVVAILLGVIGIQFVYITLVTIGWKSAGEDIKVNIRPPLPNQSLVYGRGDIPAPTAYGFAAYVWQMTKRCELDCATDEERNIRVSKYYALISEEFYSDLKRDFNTRKARGRVQGRTRELVPAQQVYLDEFVKPYKDGWQVTLDMKLKESQGGQLIKDVIIRYYFYVTNETSDANRNPWGLSVEGFVKPPVRIEGVKDVSV